MHNNIILICEICLNRNYHKKKSVMQKTNRLMIKKYCPFCHQHTLHKESR